MCRQHAHVPDMMKQPTKNILCRAGFEGTTRVRLLSWESAEAAEMKRRLDTIYFECFATDKQLLAHHRCLRDGNAMSTRGPPENAPAWMRKKVPSSGDAAPSDSTQLPMMLSSSSCGEREPPVHGREVRQ